MHCLIEHVPTSTSVDLCYSMVEVAVHHPLGRTIGAFYSFCISLVLFAISVCFLVFTFCSPCQLFCVCSPLVSTPTILLFHGHVSPTCYMLSCFGYMFHVFAILYSGLMVPLCGTCFHVSPSDFIVQVSTFHVFTCRLHVSCPHLPCFATPCSVFMFLRWVACFYVFGYAFHVFMFHVFTCIICSTSFMLHIGTSVLVSGILVCGFVSVVSIQPLQERRV